MRVIDGSQESLSSPSEPQPNEPQPKGRMIKPKIHTTKYGTQSVSALDIIESEVGWAQIERILDADLVQEPASQNGSKSSTVPINGDAA